MSRLRGSSRGPVSGWGCDDEQTWGWGLDRLASETQLTLLIKIANILMIITITIY